MPTCKLLCLAAVSAFIGALAALVIVGAALMLTFTHSTPPSLEPSQPQPDLPHRATPAPSSNIPRESEPRPVPTPVQPVQPREATPELPPRNTPR